MEIFNFFLLNNNDDRSLNQSIIKKQPYWSVVNILAWPLATDLCLTWSKALKLVTVRGVTKTQDCIRVFRWARFLALKRGRALGCPS